MNKLRGTGRLVVIATLVGSVATAAAAAAAQTPAAPPAIDADLDVLRREGLVLRRIATPGAPQRTGYAAALVRRPAAQVLAAIRDVERYREFLPQIVQSRRVGRGRRSQDVFVRLSVMNNAAFLWARVRYVEALQPSGAVVITGSALQGNVQRMDVRWRVTPVDDGAATVLEFWSLVVPDLPVPVPASLLDGEQESAARRAVEAMRQRAETLGPPVPVRAL